MVREIVTDWQTPAGGGYSTIMYFRDDFPVATQRSALGTFWAGLRGALVPATRFTVRTEGREFNSNTGALTGAWSDPVARTDVGTATGQAVPDASQVLLRWNTNVIVGRRFVVGRTFVPGLSVANVVGGNVAPAVQADFNPKIETFRSASGLVVWHRPSGGSGGIPVEVTQGITSPEFAVLRRRRN